MDSSAPSIHYFNLLQIHHLALQHYTPRTLSALLLDAPYSKPQHDKHISIGLSHMASTRTRPSFKHLASIPLVPVDQLYKHMISGITPITPFTSPEESTGDTVSTWLLFSHTEVYVTAIGSLIAEDWGYFAVISFGADLPD